MIGAKVKPIWAWRPGALLALALALAASGLTAGCATSACEADGDCALDELCQAGECATRCATDDDCSAARECRDGVCALPTRCTSASDCPADQICEGGLCQTQTEECASSVDCPPNFVCFEGGCYAPGTLPDQSDGDCEGCRNGEVCIDGSCVPLDAGGAEDADAASEDAASEDAGDEDADDEDAETEDTDVMSEDAASEDADDAGEDVALEDAEPEDTAGEVADDAGCRGSADCPPGSACFGGECLPVDTGDADGATPDAAPDAVECSGEGTRAFGELCTSEGQCCEPPCAAITPAGSDVGRGVCSRPCDGFADCNPAGLARELMCYTGGGVASQFCLESTYLDPCTEVADCAGGIPGFVCRIPSFPGAGRCTWQCTSNADCRAADSICSPVDLTNGLTAPEYLNMCVPVGTPCVDYRDCPSGLCLIDDEDPTFVPYCTAWCQVGAAGACPEGFGCAPDLNTPDLPGFGACVFLGG